MFVLVSSTVAKEFMAQAFRGRVVVACYYCDRPTRRDAASTEPHRATVDHKTPLAVGGRNQKSNMVISCRACNHAKGPLDADLFIALRHDPQAIKIARHIEQHRLAEVPQ